MRCTVHAIAYQGACPMCTRAQHEARWTRTGMASVDHAAMEACRPATEQRRAWHRDARMAWLHGQPAQPLKG